LRRHAPGVVLRLRADGSAVGSAGNSSPEKLGQQYAWSRRLGFRETTKLAFADLDSVVAMELPLYAS
jgi:hypothetical protein